MTDRDHRTHGPRHAHADAHGDRRHDSHATTPGRMTLAQSLPPSTEAPRATTAHPQLDRPARTQLRMLLQQVRDTLRVLEAQSSLADRDVALDAIETGAQLAFELVPGEQHAALVTELRTRLGSDTVAQLSEQLAGSDGQAAAMFGASAVRANQDATVQLDGDGNGLGDADVQDAAARGVSSGGSKLPHHDAIQAAFGRHDVGGVSAHVGGKAAEASATIGARAYAVGNSVAFAAAPDLHLAAHEAAHVVQQRGGVQLSGGVGRAGDPYEQHADAVADVVVRGGNAERLLDQMAPRGAAGSTAIQRAVVQRDERTLYGHYTGTDVTMQLGQRRTTVVGRLEVHERARGAHTTRLNTYELSVEHAWHNDGSDGFRGTATRSGLRVPVTIVVSGADQARIELGRHVYATHRTSDRAVMPPSTLAATSELDHAVETAPLTARQQHLVDQLVDTTRTQLGEFFAGGVIDRLAGRATPAQRMVNLAQISTAVTRLFETATHEQTVMLATAVRARLATAPAHFNDVTWDLLDWLYMAMAQSPAASGPTVEPIHAHLHIPVGTGSGSLVDGSVRHRYRITVNEAGAQAELGGGGGATAGWVCVEALGEDGHVTWTRRFPMVRGRLEMGLQESEGGSLGTTTTTTVETPFPWGPDDFAGPIGGMGGSVGGQVQVGPWTGGEQPSDSVLHFYGTGVYPPLDVNLGNGTVIGESETIGIGGYIEGGYLIGGVDGTMREQAASSQRPDHVEVPASTTVPCAFGTDETTLSEDGLHALREVLAWNQALLETSTTTIAVDGYASRLGPPDHNQHLSELRRQHVVEAIASLVPGGPLPSGTSHGEAAAAAAGVADGDNAREWRRADVRINGVLVLQLYAPITETIGTEPVVTADPDHAD